MPGAGDSLTPFLESDPVLGDVDEHFSGDYLNQETIMRAARAAGMSTATIGKLGPALIFDHTERNGEQTIVIDDSTGRAGGIPLGAEMQKRLKAAGLDVQAPTRGENGKAGDFQTPGTLVANTIQQTYFVNATTKVVLPLFKERGKPFMLVFWSRDPDGTQHNQGDSLGRLLPGINGPTSLAAIRNADDDLAALLAALKSLGLDATTDVIVTADHGFATISKESATSFAATQSYKDVPPHLLPPGFVAIDMAHGLGMRLLDPDDKYREVAAGSHPSRGDGLIGGDKLNPEVVVAANGGSDLVYLPAGDKALARKVVDILAAQDYVSGLFVSDDLGPIPGTLPISAIDLKGSAVTPLPGRGQLPHVLDRLRRSAHLRGGVGRHRPAARTGHARDVQPCRYDHCRCGDRTRFPRGLHRSCAHQQRGHRQDHGGNSSSADPRHGKADRSRAQRSDAEREAAGVEDEHAGIGARCRRAQYDRSNPVCRRDPLLERGGP